MTARALRKIEADLRAVLAEPEIDRDAINLITTRIAMQAEWLEIEGSNNGIS